MQILIALGARLFEVLLKVLLIPEFKAWKARRAQDKEIKKLVKENKAKEEAYENAKPDTAHDEFSRLP